MPGLWAAVSLVVGNGHRVGVSSVIRQCRFHTHDESISMNKKEIDGPAQSGPSILLHHHSTSLPSSPNRRPGC